MEWRIYGFSFFALLNSLVVLCQGQITINNPYEKLCMDDDDCGSNGVCPRDTKLCVCKNKRSNYPTCKDKPDIVCERDCGANGFCQRESGCLCTYGGKFPNCCTKACGKYQTCHQGECKCAYGEDFKGDCSKCDLICPTTLQTCRIKDNGDKECVCKYGKKKNDTCEVDCDLECGEGAECRSTDEGITCTTCGKGFIKVRGSCQHCDTFCGIGGACKVYQGHDVICTKCGKDRYFLNGQCLAKCPVGFVKHRKYRKCICKGGTVKIKDQCQSCEKFCHEGSKCKNSRGKVTCTECGPGYKLDGGKCEKESTIELKEWEQWGTCSKTCGGGERVRKRTCLGDSQKCDDAKTFDVEDCAIEDCCEEGTVSVNGQCQSCEKFCHEGSNCKNSANGVICTECGSGYKLEGGKCEEESSIENNEWGQWSSCSKTCGGGKRVRRRTCLGDSQECDEMKTEDVEDCRTEDCPVDPNNPCNWCPWTNWSLGPPLTCRQNERTRKPACPSPPADPEVCNANATQSRQTKFVPGQEFQYVWSKQDKSHKISFSCTGGNVCIISATCNRLYLQYVCGGEKN